MTDSVFTLLNSINMLPDSITPDVISDSFLGHIQSALNGTVIDLPMFRTNLTTDGNIENDKNVIVIDAGGTNYRCGLAKFVNGKCVINNYFECKMPGAKEPVSWDSFISFLVDSIEPFAEQADRIGFCFSYSAVITDDCDGIVKGIDKEIKIYGCEGKLIGQSINSELKKRNLSEKRVIILNDTVAALLGTFSTLNKDSYSSFSGMICGTGFNICTSYKGMIYNIEAGYFTDVAQGKIDKDLDDKSEFPGEKTLEKMISGVYIGPLCKEVILLAHKKGLISDLTAENISGCEHFNGAHVSALSEGKNIDCLCYDSDLAVVSEVCGAMLERGARCASSAIIGVLKLNKSEIDKPACFCAEGSLIAKSALYRKYLLDALDEYAVSKLGLRYEIVIGKDTTLPGSAVAALLNY